MAFPMTVAAHEPLQPVKEGIWRRAHVDQPSLEIVEMFFAQGVVTNSHAHNADEGVFIVAGKFEVTLSGETKVFVPGDSYFVQRGSVHQVRCIDKGSYVLATPRTPKGAGQADHDHGHSHA